MRGGKRNRGQERGETFKENCRVRTRKVNAGFYFLTPCFFFFLVLAAENTGKFQAYNTAVFTPGIPLSCYF